MSLLIEVASGRSGINLGARVGKGGGLVGVLSGVGYVCIKHTHIVAKFHLYASFYHLFAVVVILYAAVGLVIFRIYGIV